MHVPVLLNQVVAALFPNAANAADGGASGAGVADANCSRSGSVALTGAGGLFIDCTLGGGGHAEAILEACGPNGRLLGLDRDAEAVARCRLRLAKFGTRAVCAQAEFSTVAEVAREHGFEGADGILMDLGVSSFQLDEAERGFSFQSDGPLDMRMDQSRGQSAARLLDSFGDNWKALASLLDEFGEEPRAGKFARAILDAHRREPIRSTARLAEVVDKAAGGRRGEPRHPATRTFQALRIAVNNEFEEERAGIEAAVGLLRKGGRLAVITFHSLEDRIAKTALSAHEGKMVSLQQGGAEWEGRRPRVARVLKRAAAPDDAERMANPRARSAKLRAVERIED